MKRFAIVLCNLLIAVIGIFSIFLAMTAPMLFDAPGSENNKILWVVFWAAVILPFTCFGSLISSWIVLFKTKNIKIGLCTLFIPPGIVITVLIMSLMLIQFYCQGNFSCSP